MLLFLGGAARTGKSILSRRLLAEMRLPYLSVDVLKMGLHRAVPEFELDPDAGGAIVAERMWPLVREMSISLLYDDLDYLFEGELVPKDVGGLRQRYPSRVRACFLGYAEIAPERKLEEIRAHSGYPNDWPMDYPDLELLRLIRRNITFSRMLREESARLGFPYFDTSHAFLETVEKVVAYVRAGEGTERLVRHP